MTLRRIALTALGGLLAAPPAWAQTDVVRVAPGGPVATLQQARDRVRELRKGQAARTPVVVRFAAGTYRMAEPVVFGPEDGGVSYESEPGATVVLDGGQEIRGLSATPDGLWTARIPAAAAGRKPFEQLYVNDRRAVRARTPNEGYFYIRKQLAEAVDPATGKIGPAANRAFVASRDDLKAFDGLSADQLKDANVVVYHSWEVSRHRVATADAATGNVVLTGPAPWEFLKWGANQRYHVENVRSALDQPGEWFLDRDGTLLYKPLPGEEIGKARLVAPVAESFLSIQGDPDAGAFVEGLAFRGLTFRHAAYALPPQGQGDPQAAVNIPAVVMVDGAKRFELKGCRIEHVGTYGVWFRRGCTDSRVEHCALVDLGAGGVRIGETGMPAMPEHATGKITLDDSIIRGFGRWFPGAIGVWIGQSSDNKVVHNDIADGAYTTVSVGWSWGYNPTDCKRNVIEFNRLHHLGRNVLSDMGGVYTLGLSEGTSVSHNVIHDVDSYNKSGAGGWGLYNDEGSTGIVLEGNLVWNTTTGSYHQHYGRENVVRNNILVDSKYGQVMRSRMEDHLSFTFEKNVVSWHGGPLLTGQWSDRKNFRMDSNLYHEATGAKVEFPGNLTIEEWRKATGQEEHSKVADPKFEDAAKHDYRLKKDSPALAMGFKPFDASKAGVRGGGGAWRAEADAPLPDSIPAPAPPPLSTLEDFEGVEPSPGGYTPDFASLSHGGRPELVAVTEEAAASGRRSLKIADAAGLKNGFDPHFFYSPHYDKGLASCSFAVRAEPGAVFYHEWRDASSPYKVGPSLWIRDGKLFVGDRAVADVPAGQWLRVRIESRLGGGRPSWSLTVERPGAETLKLAGLPVAAGWKSVDWVGFVSPSEQPTAVYLDDLELGVRP